MSENSDNVGSPRPEPLGGDDVAAAPVVPTPQFQPASANAFWGDEPVAAALSQGEPLTFSTTIRTRDFFVISLVNGLLNIITLTLYRFWGKTEVRRRVWQAVRVNDEAFEYTGRGGELFVGFLLATLVLGVPFLGFVFAVQFLEERFSLLLLPLYMFVFWLWGFGMFTAYRYMASRTTWRGIRFALFGSAPTYGFMWLGYQIANGMTAGWIAPVFERLMAEQVWNHLRFGDRKFRWNQARSEAVGLYGPFALGWVGTLVLFIVGTIVMVAIVAVAGGAGIIESASAGQEPSEEAIIGLFVGIYGALLLALPIIALIWSPYQAAVLRSVTAGISLDDVRFNLDVRAFSLWWLTCSNIAILLFSLGLLMPVIQARTAKYLVRRLSATGQIDLSDVQQAPPGPRTAEGLADAFGFSLI